MQRLNLMSVLIVLSFSLLFAACGDDEDPCAEAEDILADPIEAACSAYPTCCECECRSQGLAPSGPADIMAREGCGCEPVQECDGKYRDDSKACVDDEDACLQDALSELAADCSL